VSSIQRFSCYIVGESNLIKEVAYRIKASGNTLLGIVTKNQAIIAWCISNSICHYSTIDEFKLHFQVYDILFSVVNRLMLDLDVLSTAKLAAINYHYSYLPKYAGMNATSWALLNGEKQHGVTWHLMNDLPDGGAILLQKSVPVSECDTAASLNIRCSEYALDLFDQLISNIFHYINNSIPQNLEDRLYFLSNQKPKNLGMLDFTENAEDIYKIYRALQFEGGYNEFATAKFAMDGVPYIVKKMSILEFDSKGEPSQVVDINPDGIVVQTAMHQVKIHEIADIFGEALNILDLRARHSLEIGDFLASSQDIWSTNQVLAEKFSKYERLWRENLKNSTWIDFPFTELMTGARLGIDFKCLGIFELAFSKSLDRWVRQSEVSVLAVVIAAYVKAISEVVDEEELVIGLENQLLKQQGYNENLFSRISPFLCNSNFDFLDLIAKLDQFFKEDIASSVFLNDICSRYPDLSESYGFYFLTFSVGSSRALEGMRSLFVIDIDEKNLNYSIYINDEFVSYEVANYFKSMISKCVRSLIEDFGESHKKCFSSDLIFQKDADFQDFDLLFEGHQNILNLIRENVEKMPESFALGFMGNKLTYSEVEKLSNQLANFLNAKQVSKNNVIAIYLKKSEWYCLAILGILKSGNVYLPLDSAHSVQYNEVLIKESGAKLIITDLDLQGEFSQDIFHNVLLLSELQDEILKYEAAPNYHGITPDMDAYVIYTSGSTGTPKGIFLKHAGVLNLAQSQITAFKTTSASRVLQFASFNFDASVSEWAVALASGAYLHVFDTRDLASLTTVCNVEEITHITLPPSILSLYEPAQFATLRVVVIAGEVCSKQIIQHWSDKVRLINAYGPAEATVCATMNEFNGRHEANNIGWPIINTEVTVLGNDLKPCPVGVRGEIAISGVGVAEGYIANRILSEQRFVKVSINGKSRIVYLTGDFGRQLTDGSLEFLGRKDNQVKIRGQRIDVDDITRALLSHPQISQAVTLPIQNASIDNVRLRSYYVLKKQNDKLEALLLGHWTSLYVDLHSRAQSAETDFNLSGWVSNVTDENFSVIEMREWRDDTISRIMSLAPRSILEIGCGTGLMLFQLAPRVGRYMATDISHSAIEYLCGELTSRSDLAHVKLLCQDAKTPVTISEGKFDCIVINSVSQYFPSQLYLDAVISQLFQYISQNGCIFIGDVRNYRQVDIYHSYILQHKLSKSTAASEYLRLLKARINAEHELLIDPEYFHRLKHKVPELAGLRVELKLGSYRNELNLFRYDVTLYNNTEKQFYVENFIDLPDDIDASSLLACLSKGVDHYVVNNFEDTRLSEFSNFLVRVTRFSGGEDISLARSDAECTNDIFEISYIDDMAKKHGYSLLSNWSLGNNPLNYQLYFIRNDAIPQGCIPSIRPLLKRLESWGSLHTNKPAQNADQSQENENDIYRYLVKKLPGYMLPHELRECQQFPTTIQGKIDVKALAKITEETIDDSRDDIELRHLTTTQSILIDCMKRILRLAVIKVNDNFFSIGGDSILGIQLSLKAREKSVFFQSHDLYEYPTILSLSEYIDRKITLTKNVELKNIEATQCPLSPIQNWLFSQDLQRPQHWNQSVWIVLNEKIDSLTCQLMISVIIKNHQAYSFSFIFDEITRRYIASVTGVTDDHDFFDVIDLGNLSDNEQHIRFISATDRLQKGFQLKSPPLLRVLYASRGKHKKPWLALICHHLVVDAVSWRIFLNSFCFLARKHAISPASELQPELTPWVDWIALLYSDHVRKKVLAQSPYWVSQLACDFSVGSIMDFPDGNNDYLSYEKYCFSLSEVETKKLSLAAIKTLDADLEIVFLASVVFALMKTAASDDIVLNMEKHGRESFEVGGDVSNTIGWFTTIFPVRFKVDRHSSLKVFVDEVKKIARAIPMSGIGFGILRQFELMNISGWKRGACGFNYYGHWVSTDEDVYELIALNPSSVYSQLNQRYHALEVNAQIMNSCAELDWGYSQDQFTRKTIHRIAENQQFFLNEIVALGTEFLEESVSDPSCNRSYFEDYPIRPPCSYPTTSMQKAILYSYLRNTKDNNYLLQNIFRIKGPLDWELLKKSWRLAVNAFDALRSGFVFDCDEIAMQFVIDNCVLNINYEDWGAYDEQAIDDLTKKLIDEDSARRYILDQPSLQRVYLRRIDDNSHFLLWSVHHLILDGWSGALVMNYIINNTITLHQAKTSMLQKECSLSRYHHEIKSIPQKAGKQFWVPYLKDCVSSVLLDNEALSAESSPSGKVAKHASFRKILPSELSEYSSKNDLPLSVLLQTAWAFLLSKYTLSIDVVFGLTVSGRDRPIQNIDKIVGNLINTLPYRTRFNPEETIGSALRVAMSNLAEIIRYSDTGLYEIHRWLGLVAGDELFNTIFAIENYPECLVDNVANITFEQLECYEQTEYPLSIIIECRAGVYHAKITYETARMSERFIRQILDHYVHLVRFFSLFPELRFKDICILSDQEAIMVGSASTGKTITTNSYETIIDHIKLQVDANPLAIALVDDVELSYADLWIRVSLFSNVLVGTFSPENKNIAVKLPMSIDYICMVLAIMNVGACYLPIDVSDCTERISSIESCADLIITHCRYGQCDFKLTTSPWLCLSCALNIGAASYQTERGSAAKAEGYAYLISSSGTTGAPKLIAIKHSQLLASTLARTHHYTEYPPERYLLLSSPAFDSSIAGLFWTLCSGGVLHLLSEEGRKNLNTICSRLVDQKITHTLCIPSLYLGILREIQADCLLSLKTIIVAGEACPEQLVTQHKLQCHHVILVNEYGPTEGAVWSHFKQLHPAERLALSPISIGKPIEGVTGTLVDSYSQACPFNVVGELVLSGKNIIESYYHHRELNPNLTKLIPKKEAGVFRTGDLGYLNYSGEVVLVGRVDSLVKLLGKWINLAKLEDLILNVYHGLEVGVVVHSREGLVAFVKGKIDNGITEIDLNPDILQKESGTVLPRRIILLSSMPKLPNGKINRSRLASYPLSLKLAKKNSAVDTRPDEKKIIILNVCRELLLNENITLQCNFVSSGGDSILCMQLVSRLRRVHYKIEISDIFECKSISELSSRAELLDPSSTLAVLREQIDVGKHVPMTPSQRWFLKKNVTKPSHFVQIIKVKLNQEIETPAMYKALTLLLSSNSVLKVKFNLIEKTMELNNDNIVPILICLDDGSSVSDDDGIKSAVDSVIAQFDLGRGVLVGAVCSNNAKILILIIHHFVIDALSWPRIMNDLSSYYTRELNSALGDLVVADKAYLEWADCFNKYAIYNTSKSSLSIDSIKDSGEKIQFPCDFEAKEFNEEGVHVSVLSKKLTQSLGNASLVDILIAAVVIAGYRMTEKSGLYLLLELHGRDLIETPLQLSDATGWFTSFCPLQIVITDPEDITRCLGEVSAKLDSLKKISLDYMVEQYSTESTISPNVVFNYLGNVDNYLSNTAFSDKVTLMRSPSNNLVLDPLTINTYIKEDKIYFDFGYSLNHFKKETIVDFSNQLKAVMSDIAIELLQKKHSETRKTRLPAEIAENIDNKSIWRDLLPMQESMLLSSLFFHQSLYHVQTRLFLSGIITRHHFYDFFEKAAEAYVALRIDFRVDGSGKYRQKINGQINVDIQYIDLSDKEPHTKELLINSYVDSDALNYFNLDSSPLWRAALLKIDAVSHILVFTHHHAILDGWSLGLLIRQFCLYATGTALTQDFYLECIERVLGRQSKDRDYWEKRLGSISSASYLSQRNSYKDSRDYREHGVKQVFSIEIPMRIQDRLKAKMRSSNLTINTQMLAAWLIVLRAFQQSDQIITGVTVSGRSSLDSEIFDCIGPLINTIPLVVDGFLEMDLDDFLQQLQFQLNEHSQYCSLALSDLQSMSCIDENAAFFDTLYVFENHPLVSALNDKSQSGIELKVIDGSESNGIPLTWMVIPGEVLRIRVVYDAEHFTEDFVENIVGNYIIALMAVVSELQKNIININVVPLDQFYQKLINFNHTDISIPECALPHLIEDAAKKYALKTAVIFQGDSVSYHALNEKANRLASYLHQSRRFVSRGFVAVMLPRSLDLVVGLLAIIKLGNAYVPIDEELPAARIKQILEDAEPWLLITHSYMRLQYCSDSYELVFLDKICEHLNIASTKNLNIDISTNDPVNLLYTSGSSGKPKGVLLEHAGLVNRLFWMRSEFAVDSTAKVLHKTPISFDVAGWEIFLPLISGAAVVMLAPREHANPDAISQAIKHYAVSMVHFVPAMLEIMVDYEDFCRDSPLEYVVCSGEALNEALQNKFFNRLLKTKLYNLYGPTEASIDVSFWQCIPSQRVMIGEPIYNTKLYVLGEDLEILPSAVPGELCIAGVGLAREYWRMPAETSKCFVDNPYTPGGMMYRTGDFCLQHPNGFLEYIGRKDGQIKIRGQRVEIAEIQQKISEVIMFRFPVIVRYLNKELFALVITALEFDSYSWREFCSTNRQILKDIVPRHMIPDHFIQLDKPLLTHHGKANWKAIDKVIEDYKSNGDLLLNQDRILEQKVAMIWAQALNAQNIPVTADLFSVGGHSLTATRILIGLHAAGYKQLRLQDVFEYSTIRGMAHYLAENTDVILETDLGRPLSQKNELIPLSHAQESLYLHSKLSLNGLTYIISDLYKVSGGFNCDIFKAALNYMLQRHEILRVRIIENRGRGYQQIDENCKLSFHSSHLDELSMEAVQSDISEAFDLSKSPLWRFSLYITPQHVYILSIFHHLITDARSQYLFFSELWSYYNNIAHNAPMQYEKLKSQYSDYVMSEQKNKLADIMQDSLRFWSDYLNHCPLQSTLQPNFPRLANLVPKGRLLSKKLPAELRKRVSDFTRAHQVTPFMLTLSVLYLLMLRYSGQQDIVVGVPVENRNEADTYGMLGLFINTMVIRIQSKATVVFSDLLAEVKSLCTRAFVHQGLPFEKVIETLKIPRDLSYNPLFQVMFSYEVKAKGAAHTDFKLEHIQLDTCTAKCDLSFALLDDQGDLEIGVEYDVNLYHHSAVERMLAHYQILLEGVIQDSQCQLGKYNLLSEIEWSKLTAWNNTDCEYSYGDAFCRIKRMADNYPESIAISMGDKKLSYKLLVEKLPRVAKVLASMSKKINPKVGLLCDRDINYIVIMLSIWLSGGCYVAIEPKHPTEKIKKIINHCNLDLVIIDVSYESLLPCDGCFYVLTVDSLLNESEQLVCGWTYTKDLFRADDLAYIVHTSGSTGEPKGVMIHYQGLINHLFVMIDSLDLIASDVIAQNAPQSFDVSVWQMSAALLVGARIHIIASEQCNSAKTLLNILSSEEISILEIVPSQFNYLLAVIEKRPEIHLSLRYVMPTGETLPAQLVKRWFAHRGDIPLINAYGPAECSDDVTIFFITKENYLSLQESIPIGKPVANMRVYILNDALQPLPVGMAGEIYISGIGVGPGYLGLVEETKKSFLANPFADGHKPLLYKTGDIGVYKEDGNIIYIGRVDNQVKLCGVRIDPGEIESALNQFPGITQSVVMMCQYGDRNILVAYLLSDVAELCIPEIKEWLRKYISPIMVPVYWLQVDQFYLNSNGKIDRSKLVKPQESEIDSSKGADQVPRDYMEKSVLDIFRSALKDPFFDVADDFFMSGGNSLVATDLAFQIQARLGLSICLIDLFKYPTVRLLCENIEEKGGMELESAIRKLPRYNRKFLSSTQQRMWFFSKLNPDSAAYNMPLILRFDGEICCERLIESFNHVVLHNDILRSSIKEEEGVPYAIITDMKEFKVDFFEIANDAISLNHHLQHKLSTVIPIDADYLWRAEILKISDSQHYLLLVFHHVVIDNLSLQNIHFQLAEYYSIKGAQTCADGNRVQFYDYAAWEKQWLNGGRVKLHEEYWREKLRNLPEPIRFLSSECPDGSLISRSGHLIWELSEKATTLFRRFCNEMHCSLFMGMLTVYMLLLHQILGRDDIIVGAPVSNRQRPEAQEMIGPFINSLPFRALVDIKGSIRKFFSTVKEVCLEAYENKELPFEKILSAANIPRNLEVHPIYQVWFVLENYTDAPIWPQVSVSEVELESVYAKFDLSFWALEKKSHLTCGFEFSINKFSVDEINSFSIAIENIMKYCVNFSENSVGSLADALFPQNNKGVVKE
jgi:amino acid adenylation domain-containing protein/non-ribosomal peptide synthase protein (TIGR01720 family)